jgi:hypothetical protein
MTEKIAEFGNIALRRWVGSDYLQQLTAADIANFVVEQHHRLRAKKTAGIERMIWCGGHGVTDLAARRQLLCVGKIVLQAAR